MMFNSGTNSLYADALYWSGATSVTYPVDPDFTRNANIGLDRVNSLIFKADKNWRWVDSNLSSELIDITTNLVSGTAKYAISVTWLKIGRIRVKDSNGNWITLKYTDRKHLSDSQLAASGTPSSYYLLGGYIYLNATPNYSQSAGIEVQYQRGSDYFVVADTTKTPGFASHFHRLVSLYAALDFCEANEMAKRAARIQARIDKLEPELIEHYSVREDDESPSLNLRSEDYGGAGLDDSTFNSNSPYGFG